jgi:hypothetical protein
MNQGRIVGDELFTIGLKTSCGPHEVAKVRNAQANTDTNF